MPGHYSDPGWEPDYGEQRPNLFVPFSFLRSTSSRERRSLLIGFYDRFRQQEAFDNYHRVNPRPPAGLREIYDCYCDEYIQTVKKAREMDGALTFKRGKDMNHGKMGWEMFAHFLDLYDEDQMARQVTPPRSPAASKDMLPLWNKHDGWGDIKHRIEKSNPVIKLDHSSRAKDRIVDSVLKNVQAD